MSYLDTPRLHFFGQFTANPSTVNNAPTNYDFGTALVSSWNDDGNHAFSIQNCQVTSVVMPTAGATAGDGVIGAALASTGRAVLVDLDTQQQLVSTIYGLTIQISAGGATITGLMTPVNFFDINFGRANIPGGPQTDGVAGAAYQSVLTNVSIEGTWDSPWVDAIQPILAANGNMLSIRFTVDGMHDNAQGPLFTIGRITGTIGPYFTGEPETFVNGRLLRPVAAGAAANYNYIPAKTDTARKKLVVDFANAFTTTWPTWPNGFPVADPADLTMAIQASSGTINLGAIGTTEAAYETYAMVQEFDVSNDLTDLANSPTAVLGGTAGTTVFLSENSSGAFAMFEPFVFRLDPNEPGNATLYANVFELPAPGASIGFDLVPALLQNQLGGGPAVGTPANGISFPATVQTGVNGQATIALTANANGPGNPRGYLDGQLYPIAMNWSLDTNPDPNTFLSVHCYDLYEQPTTPVWKDVQWILAIYARLYPAMMAIINLANYDDVVASAPAIATRLQYSIDNPGLMPITRELSTAKMQTVVTWINNGTPA
jgi:hypothetical protein